MLICYSKIVFEYACMYSILNKILFTLNLTKKKILAGGRGGGGGGARVSDFFCQKNPSLKKKLFSF